nr:Transposase InsD for insertion element IS2 [Escherichia coli]
MDSARALIARGWGVSLVSRCLRVSRAQLHVILRRTDDWKDGRRSRHSDDTDVLATFALDCCDREALHWAASTCGYDSETVQDVMLGAVERRFGNRLPTSPVEWLTDNGSAYRSHQTRQFARMVGLEPKHTAVRSPESNGMAESFVKTMKRDYISIMPKPDGLTAAKNLAEAFEHYNEWHPHSALGYRSPREYLRQQASNGLSDNRKTLEILIVVARL